MELVTEGFSFAVHEFIISLSLSVKLEILFLIILMEEGEGGAPTVGCGKKFGAFSGFGFSREREIEREKRMDDNGEQLDFLVGT